MSAALLDPAHIVPIRVVVDQRRRLSSRLAAGSVQAVVALLLNMLVVAGMVHWAFPRDIPPPEQKAIDVDIINESPKQAEPKADPSAKAESSVAQAETQQGEQQPAPAPVADAAPKAPEPQPPTPTPPPPDPVQTPPAAQPEPKPTVTPQSVLSLNPVPESAPPKAMPAPVGEESPTVKPHLVEVPPDPRPAPPVNAKAPPADPAVKPAEITEPGPPAAPAPRVLTTEAGDDAVAQPAPSASSVPDKPVTPTVTKEQAENTAKLAAALPLSQSFMSDATGAAAAGSGTATDQQYKGAVYGSFSKANDVVEEARAKNLKGQTVVAFTLDDQGGLKSLAIAVSSGNPQVDAAALEMIRRSAPFPPPPPGAARTFSPAIRLGLDD